VEPENFLTVPEPSFGDPDKIVTLCGSGIQSVSNNESIETFAYTGYWHDTHH